MTIFNEYVLWEQNSFLVKHIGSTKTVTHFTLLYSSPKKCDLIVKFCLVKFSSPIILIVFCEKTEFHKNTKNELGD
ncbi:hypothetical protein P872_22955 [Rhodonellum psychrophilum GCM71 = DSM 17998]|uniref:Uncharacterized protein n=1 Tax=Rhodonellum psychrophilum GCM71 = DSM 17998 TaxID=1123057 RepID=U5C553_9BACT|nr:hypothetical protein P872_22955 [Rhodonellum psychrophilum GCM71 = DSM 17998]